MSQDRLSRLAEQVVAEQDEAQSLTLDTERGLTRLRRATQTSSSRRPHRLLAAALAATLGTLALWGWYRRSVPLTFEVTQQAPAAGEWLAPVESSTLAFSDGTRVTVDGGSRARVAAIDAEGATIELDRGAIRAEVEPRSGARWRMQAGPYAVLVTGTAFVMRWDPDTKQLHIEMIEGSVRVTGPDLGDGRDLAAPQRLHLAPRPETSSVATSTASPAHAVTVEPSATVAPTAAPASSVSWRELDAKGLRSEAMDEVRRTGQPALVAREDAAGLLRLAQIARLEGDNATSQRFLSALRRRFPETLQAQTATYLAGKSHHDTGRHEAAIADLQAYLAMAPDGAFAREAQVLLILSLLALGDPRADGQARAYLAKHGDDVHAPRIRKALATP